MRQSSFTESKRLAILAEQDAAQPVEEIYWKHQPSPATFYKWKKDLGYRPGRGQTPPESTGG